VVGMVVSSLLVVGRLVVVVVAMVVVVLTISRADQLPTLASNGRTLTG